MKGETHVVTAAVHSELRCERNAADQEQQGVETVDDDHEQRVDGEGLVEGGREQIDEREHGEDGEEHAVVDDRWVAGECVMDHVAGQGHDEERP